MQKKKNTYNLIKQVIINQVPISYTKLAEYKLS